MQNSRYQSYITAKCMQYTSVNTTDVPVLLLHTRLSIANNNNEVTYWLTVKLLMEAPASIKTLSTLSYQGNTLFLWILCKILLLQYNFEWVYTTTACTTNYTVFHKKPDPETSCYNFKKMAFISKKRWNKQSTHTTKVIVNVRNFALRPQRRLWVVSFTGQWPRPQSSVPSPPRP